jgi:hypothetical protein
MIITVLNHTKTLADEEVQRVIRAVNRQIRDDFESYWSLGATLRLEGKSTKKPTKIQLADMRGDAVLYLWDEVDVDDALGYHYANNAGIPFGFIFTELVKQLKEEWSVTLSHEALELIADPLVNLLVSGPHPVDRHTVFHWYEMSDAVQAETYECDGVEVSNFVLPLYFTPDAEPGSRNDFLGRKHDGATLKSFGINPGGYIGFFDPKRGKDVTYAHKDDKTAKRRLKVKKAQAVGRRTYRTGGYPREQALAQRVSTLRGSPRAAAPAARAEYEEIDT